jgi:hypothetical protein
VEASVLTVTGPGRLQVAPLLEQPTACRAMPSTTEAQVFLAIGDSSRGLFI